MDKFPKTCWVHMMCPYAEGKACNDIRCNTGVTIPALSIVTYNHVPRAEGIVVSKDIETELVDHVHLHGCHKQLSQGTKDEIKSIAVRVLQLWMSLINVSVVRLQWAFSVNQSRCKACLCSLRLWQERWLVCIMSAPSLEWKSHCFLTFFLAHRPYV
jgi:hypothetical protein